MKRRPRWRRSLLLMVSSLLLFCVAAAGAAAWSNRSLPAGPAVLDRLDALDMARLDEATQLRSVLGDAVWPGWAIADIPLLVWNHEYAFLTGFTEAPSGWETVPGDTWSGQPYYRQAGGDPQNFIVLIGGRWVASLATKWQADQFLIGQFRDMLPGPLNAVFPYRFLIQPTEAHLSGLLHETFHAYQAQTAPARLEAAEAAHALGDEYWRLEDTLGNAAWRAETSLLARALGAADASEARSLAGQFLAQRDERRAAGVPAHLVAFEQQLEWEEGLAKYVELSIWRAASEASGYAPSPALASDPDFHAYATFAAKWSQELTTLRLQGGQQGETRFYYTGMAQASLLDRLLPGWQAEALNNQATVEALLRAAVEAGD
jgi:hypothetical protein